MKPNPDMTVESMLKEIIESNAPVKAVGRESSAAEIAEATVKFKEMLADHATKVRTLCVACGTDKLIAETTLCACGGFVCADCARVEVEGECLHEPEFPPDDED